MSKLAIYFDYISPFPYFLNERILKDDLEARYPLEIEWIPVFLGGLHPANDHTPLNATDPRRWKYSAVEAQRYSRELGVAYTPNMFKPIPVLRAAIAAGRQGLFRAFHSELYRALQGKGLAPDDALLSGLIANLGGDGKRLLEDMQRPEVKQALIANGERAKGDDVFGVPFVIHNQQPYWGYSHFDYLLRDLDAAAATQ
jgi:2-hydroxychromene-2-carboxylate isomerase